VPPRKKAIALDPAVYEDYVGVYEVQPGVEVTVQVFQDRLFASMTGEGAGEFLPESETKFFLEARNAITLEFQRGDDGAVSAVVVSAPGQQVTAKRIK
jgi:hypothetical protein